MNPIKALANIPYQWAVVVLCIVATLPIGFVSLGFGALYPFIQEDLNINRAQLGLIASGPLVGGTVTSLFVGWLADVIGVRRLQAAALVAIAATLVLYALMQSLAQGIALGLLIGAVQAVSYPATAKAIIDWQPPRRRGLSLGILEASIPGSGLISALLLTFVAVTFSWRVAVVVVAVAIAMASLSFYLYYRDAPSNRGEEIKPDRPSGRLSMVLKNRDIWLASLSAAALAGVMSVVFSYMVLFLKEDMSLSAGLAGSLLAVVMGAGTVGRVGWGLVSDLMLGGRRVVILAFVASLSALSMAFLALLSSAVPLEVVLLVLLFVGVTTLGWGGLHSTLLAELVEPGLTGTAIGLASTIIRLIAFGVIPLFGLIVDKTGSYEVGWWMMTGLTVVGVSLLGLMRPQARAR